MPNGSPFEPTEFEAVAITNIGLMFAHITVLVVFILLMFYCRKKFREYSAFIVIYLFSLILGMTSLQHPHTPFSPMFEIFFVLFQTTIFIQTAIEFYTDKKNGINRI